MNQLPSIRRWGVAALTGVTLFGGLSIVGGGVASAAAPAVTASVTGTATTIAGTGAGQAGATINIAVAGTPVANDEIVLTLACPTTGTAAFATAPNSGSTDFSATPVIGTNANGCSTATYTELAAVANPTLTVIPTFNTSSVATQPLSIAGAYVTVGSTTNFAVPTDANVQWFGVTANTPTVYLPTTGTTAISPITLTESANVPTAERLASNSTVTFTLPGSDVFSGTPTVTSSPAGATAPTAAIAGGVLTLNVGTAPSAGVSGSYTVSNLSVTTTNAPRGAQNVAISGTNPAQVIYSAVNVGTILGTATTIYGPDGTADGTVAAEFEHAYPAGNTNVVLATDAPYTNGSDALAASYLEGTLGTGLLITSPTQLGADAQSALRIEGVSSVYVVGGPKAVSPAVIAQIEALPAYTAGGVALTGSNVKVVAQIYGADGTAEGTAAKIATYFNSYGNLNVSGAYATTNGHQGVYNNTTGSASTTAPTGNVPTAIVVASSAWQDAMSIAPEAFNNKLPVILAGPSSSTTLGINAATALTSLNVKQVIIIGGPLAVQNSVETQIAALNGGISVLRIAGIDATDTAAQIANFAFGAVNSLGLGFQSNAQTATHAVMASHANYWSDALGSAAYGSINQEPLILVESPLVIGQYTTAELPILGAAPDNIYNLTVLGGPLAMPSSTVNSLLAGL